ncbi:MAG TPA: hypothetical protein PKZ07_00920 [Sedimentisphaerales bacterium]|nr:hypothetical protein [Sedimentisphaerales bacterium]
MAVTKAPYLFLAMGLPHGSRARRLSPCSPSDRNKHPHLPRSDDPPVIAHSPAVVA